jgi:ribonuclease P protein component
MLSKKKRVDKKTFQTILKKGKIISSPFFTLYFIQNKEPRYAFVAPKKIFKIAIKRNKMRRIGYNVLRNISIHSGLGVFIYKKEAISLNIKEIQEKILLLLKKVSVLNKDND